MKALERRGLSNNRFPSRVRYILFTPQTRPWPLLRNVREEPTRWPREPVHKMRSVPRPEGIQIMPRADDWPGARTANAEDRSL